MHAELARIEKWEKGYFQEKENVFDRVYEKSLKTAFQAVEEKKKEKIFRMFDELLFYLNALVENSRILQDDEKQLLIEAKVYDKHIESIADLKKLSLDVRRYMSQKQAAKMRLLSLGQGGVTGFGGLSLLSADFVFLVAINLRAIQLIGMCHGFDMKRPFETLVALKLLNIMLLPKKRQRMAWQKLWEEIEEKERNVLLFNIEEEITDAYSLREPLHHLLKAFFIVMLRKKLVQGIPMAGISIGAALNYQFTRQTTEVATNFYEKRALLEELKKGNMVKETR